MSLQYSEESSFILHDETFLKEHLQEIEDYYAKNITTHKISYNNIDLYAHITNSDKSKTLVIVPGRAEVLHKYKELVYNLKDANIKIVIAFVRGQGDSTRFFKDSPKCHIECFEDYTNDLEIILKELNIKKFSMLSFSLGCLISLDFYLHKKDFEIQKIALLEPYLWPYFLNLNKKILQAIIYTSYHLGFAKSYTPHGSEYKYKKFELNNHSHSKFRYEYYHSYYEKHQDKALGGPSFAFVYHCMQKQKEILNKDFQFNIPIFIAVAMEDKVVDSNESIKFYLKHKSDKVTPKLIKVAYAYHDLLNERDDIRHKAIQSALEFLLKGENNER